MGKYKPQEKDYSCGASALRNAILHFKIADVTEKTVRNICNTTRKNGTNENGLLEGAWYYGFETNEWEVKSPQVFKRKVTKALRAGRVIILNSDGLQHWILAIEYQNRKVRVIDSMYREAKKSIDQWLTLKQLAEMCNCFDRERNSKYFYGIECWLEEKK